MKINSLVRLQKLELCWISSFTLDSRRALKSRPPFARQKISNHNKETKRWFSAVLRRLFGFQVVYNDLLCPNDQVKSEKMTSVGQKEGFSSSVFVRHFLNKNMAAITTANWCPQLCQSLSRCPSTCSKGFFQQFWSKLHSNWYFMRIFCTKYEVNDSVHRWNRWWTEN